MPHDRTAALGAFVRLFVPIAAVVLLVIAVVATDQQARFREAVEVRERALVAAERQAMESRLSAHLSDAVLLADIVALHVFGDLSAAELREHLIDELTALSMAKRVYDQVRFIDAAGMEVVRVNWSATGPVVVAEEKLQDKSDRPYFTRGLRTRGEVYVSELDLNVERSQIEEPHKPMVRLATPVTDAAGQVAGVVVLNYLGDHLLDRLRQVSAASVSDLYLVNPAGYWLVGPSPEDEWGFMLPDRAEASMAAQQSEAWARVAAAETGQFQSEGALFTFETASPLGFQLRDQEPLHHGEAEEAWKVVSVVAPADLVPAWRRSLIWMVGGLLLLLGTVTWQVARAKAKRREALAAAGELEDKLRVVSETVQDGVIMANAAAEVVYWNPAAAAMFGSQPDEVMGKNLHTLVAGPEDQARAAAGREQFARSGDGPIVGRLREVEARKQDGSTFPAELSVSSIELAGVWHAVGTIRDITERRAVESELNRYREHLEESVTERTLQLQQANEELEAARDRAESANRAKSAFLANVSHEIRTPLNGIVGFTEILSRDAGDASQMRYLDSISRSGQALLHLIDDILDMSRLEAGSLDLHVGPVETLKILADTRTALVPGAESKGLDFRVDVDSQVPRMLVLDEKRLSQVLTNLIDNAIKFTRRGEVSVAITASAPGETVDLSLDVTDTGIGIPEDQYEEIFAPFTQQRDQSINEYGGTGLGLALARGLLTRMGGTIEVESQVNEGTTFHVSLPGVEVADATPIGSMATQGQAGPASPAAEQPATWSAAGMDEPARARLAELVRSLESQVPLCAELTATLTVNEIEDFAAVVQEQGAEFAVPPVVEWAKRLAEQMTVYDMEAVARTLSAFPQLVEEVRAAHASLGETER